MTVLNVLSTNTIAAADTEYQTVQTGYYRVVATAGDATICLLYTSPSPRDQRGSRIPSSA